MVLCDKGEVTLHFRLLIASASNRVSVMKGNSGEHKMTVRKLSVHNWVLAAGSCFVGDTLSKWIALEKKKYETLICFRCKSQILFFPPPLFWEETCKRHTSPDPNERLVYYSKHAFENVIRKKWLLIPEQEHTNISICLFKGNVTKINIK